MRNAKPRGRAGREATCPGRNKLGLLSGRPVAGQFSPAFRADVQYPKHDRRKRVTNERHCSDPVFFSRPIWQGLVL